MIQELVELGRRVTEGKSRALKDEIFSIVLIINEKGEFQPPFLVGQKQTIQTEVITAKKGKARFLLDKCEEVLGIGDSNADKKHQLFMEKLDLIENTRNDFIAVFVNCSPQLFIVPVLSCMALIIPFRINGPCSFANNC